MVLLWPASALGHELIELSLVPSLAQPFQEGLEFPLLLLKASHRLVAILVKRAIAA